jgi:hypothetical protein
MGRIVHPISAIALYAQAGVRLDIVVKEKDIILYVSVGMNFTVALSQFV